MAYHVYERCCDICGGKLKKNGKTSAGKTRYRCAKCGASTTARRQGPSKQAQMRRFHSWLLGSGSRTERGLNRSDWRDMSWCWNVPVPEPEVTGEVYTALMADGTYFQDWCLIVAYNGKHVTWWQWAQKENKPAYIAALSRFPPPRIVVIDGHRAAFEAVRQVWADVLIQRCLFHTKARVRQLITMHPRTDCGIEIKKTHRHTHLDSNPDTSIELAGRLLSMGTTLARLPQRTHLSRP